MGTNYIAPTWRIPENTNKDKLSNYSINFSGGTRTHIGIGEVVGGPLLPGGQTYTSNVTVQNPKFSGSAFINFNTSSSYPVAHIVGVGQLGGGTLWYLRKTANNNIEFTVRTLAASPFYATVTGSTVLSPNQWYHAAFSWDGNTITLYLNGSVDGSVSATTFYNSSFQYSGYASIGSKWIGGISINTLWVGKISQVCVFDYDLSVEQITYLQNLNNPMAISGAEPVAYWPLGDNSNPTASAGYPNISVGADSVFDFNSSFIDPGSVDLGVNGSVAMWFNPEVGSVTDYVLLGEGSQGFDYVIRRQSGAFYIWIGGTFYNFAIGNNIVDGSWNFLVITKSAGDVNVYLKNPSGEFSGSHTNAGWTSASFKFDRIGGRTINPINLPFNGEISNFQAWDTTLTNTEITTLYNNGQPIMTGTQPQAANLKVWYKLNQYESHWNIGGNGKWVMEDNSSPYTKSFALDSANSPADYFNTNAGPRGMTTNVGTYSCWINLNSVAGNQVFMDVSGFASREFLNLKIRSNHALQMEMRSWSTQMLWDSVTTTPFEVGKWYHVVAVGDGTNIKMYINGDEISTYIASGSYRWWSNFNTSIAHNGGNKIYLGAGFYPTRHSPLNGRISNAQIWNTNLSPSQVETLYNGGHPLQGTQPASTNLLAWYKLNQDSTWVNYNYWNNILINKWNSKNYAITTTPPTESLGFSGVAQDGDHEGWEVTNKSISGSLLLSFWYKTSGNQIYTWTFNNDGSGNANAGKLKMQGNGYIYFFSPNASNYFYKVASNLGDYNWHNLIIYIPNGSPTYDPNDINMWQDGVEFGTPSLRGSTTWDAFTEIKGMNRNGGLTGTGTQWSNWALFENVTPSDSVIETIFNRGTPGDISSLNPSIWYKLDSTDTTFGTTGPKSTALSITDSSSNNNNATGPYDYDAAINSRPVIINGDVQNAIAGYYMSGNELTDFSVSARDGESSGMNTTNIVQSNLTRKVPYSSYSINFDSASGDAINCGNDSSLGLTSNFSVSAWMKSSSQGSYAVAVSKNNGNNGFSLQMRKNNNRFAFNINDGSWQQAFYDGINPIDDGKWHHVVGTFDGSTIKIYVDNIKGTDATNVGTMVSSTANFSIAAQTTGLFFNGQISNVSYWNTVLTEDDIINLYNNGITQDLNNFRVTPVAWWPMDQSYTYFNGSVLVARDVIGGRDGTGVNLVQSDIEGSAPGSDTNGVGANISIVDLKGNMSSSSNNSHSINMADYADGVTNPANSGRSTDTPS